MFQYELLRSDKIVGLRFAYLSLSDVTCTSPSIGYTAYSSVYPHIGSFASETEISKFRIILKYVLFSILFSFPFISVFEHFFLLIFHTFSFHNYFLVLIVMSALHKNVSNNS